MKQFFVCLFMLILITMGCQRTPNRVTIQVDDEQVIISTNAITVREALNVAGITLNELDRVEPDLYAQLTPEMMIQVMRITETITTELIIIPFERRIIPNEALPEDEQQLVQIGSNGQEQITRKITYQDGQEIDRHQVSHEIVQKPVEEIIAIGRKAGLSDIPIDGIVAYISGGNAWLMSDHSSARRVVTTKGDLDGHAFSLSPNGERLLYSRNITDVITAPLNELWQVDTQIVGETAISTPLKGVLYAEWSPQISETVIAYSTAERSPGSPGWRAYNDLWLWDTKSNIETATEIVPANTTNLYAWWGTDYYWSPDGNSFAYSNASQVGIIDIVTKTIMPLMDFTPYETNSNWVWLPSIAWSPDSRFIATVIPSNPQQFDMWIIAVDGSMQINVIEQVGMWSNPIWHEDGIIFGQAVNPLRSVDSHYMLMMMDWDGSNLHRIFPIAEEIGLTFPDVAVARNESIIFVIADNLHLLDFNGLPPQALTIDGQSHQPQWVIPLTKTVNVSVTTVISD